MKSVWWLSAGDTCKLRKFNFGAILVSNLREHSVIEFSRKRRRLLATQTDRILSSSISELTVRIVQKSVENCKVSAIKRSKERESYCREILFQNFCKSDQSKLFSISYKICFFDSQSSLGFLKWKSEIFAANSVCRSTQINELWMDSVISEIH